MSKTIKKPSPELDASYQRIVVMIAAITEAAKGKRGVSGKMECPCCQTGTLRWSIARSNGHIAAICSTDGCGKWIQ